MEEKIKQLEGLLATQLADGNWNYDPYMHGMANGIIFAMSILTGEELLLLDAPKEWLCDKKTEHILCNEEKS